MEHVPQVKHSFSGAPIQQELQGPSGRGKGWLTTPDVSFAKSNNRNHVLWFRNSLNISFGNSQKNANSQ